MHHYRFEEHNFEMFWKRFVQWHSQYGVSSYREISEKLTAKEESRAIRQLEPEWTYFTSKKCINIHNEEVSMTKCK